MMNAGTTYWSRPLAGGPSHSKWRTRGNDYYSSGGPLQTLRCHHFRLCGVLVTCRLSGTATCRSKRPRTAQPPPCPLGPAGAILQRMGTPRGRGQATRRGEAMLKGRGFSSMNRAKVTERRPAWGHLADSEVAGCFPKASLLEASGSPRGPRGPEDILTVCVIFKSDSHGSMTHFRAAELQKLRSACVASAGPPGTTARLTWKKHEGTTHHSPCFLPPLTGTAWTGRPAVSEQTHWEAGPPSARQMLPTQTCLSKRGRPVGTPCIL